MELLPRYRPKVRMKIPGKPIKSVRSESHFRLSHVLYTD